MKHHPSPLAALACCIAFACTAAAETNGLDTAAGDTPGDAPSTAAAEYKIPPFEAYQTIITRLPFGEPKTVKAPPVAVKPQPASPLQNPAIQAIARALRMSAVVKRDDKVNVGFTDNNAKPPKSIYLAVGETKDGYKLIDADYKEETATIEKDGHTFTMKLGVGLVETPGAADGEDTPAPAAPALTAARTRPVPSAPAINRTPPMPAPPTPAERFDPNKPENWPMPQGNLAAIDKLLGQGITNSSYRDRLLQRRRELQNERASQDAETAKAIDEAAEERAAEMFLKMMRRKNLQMIRDGEGSLGIPLTADEDAQLTAEGVLPPQED